MENERAKSNNDASLLSTYFASTFHQLPEVAIRWEYNSPREKETIGKWANYIMEMNIQIDFPDALNWTLLKIHWPPENFTWKAILAS